MKRFFVQLNLDTQFGKVDDVRVFVPQYAKEFNATNAHIALQWMLTKYPNIVSIPDNKTKGRIMENLKASEISLTDQQFKTLDKALNQLEIHGHRGYVQLED